MAATIRDIAKKADVSIATVSRYLNNPEIVSEKTKKKIVEAIEQLKYLPNDIARSLTTKNSYTIGLILPDINNVFYPPVLRGIEDIAEQHHFITFLCNTDQNIQREKKYIDALLGRQVSGIIFIGTRKDSVSENAHILTLAEKIPILMLYESFEGEKIQSVVSDETIGSVKAVRYLYELGHRKIAFVSAPPDYSTYKRKQLGYITALGDLSIPVREDYIVYQDAYESGGYLAMCELLKLGEDMPTAVHATSDQMAVGIMRAIFEHGLHVPKDISVVGYSNSFIASQVYPRLTTIDQAGYRLGQMAGDKIIHMIEKGTLTGEIHIVEPELVIRDSCRAIGHA